ncbi:MAG: glycoside hydrolase family 2 TIM barrel-domain containing protein [Planctomycetota bacterium]
MHQGRSVESLCGEWSFSFLEGARTLDVDPARLAFKDKMLVPCCFDVVEPWLGKRGTGAYARGFTVCARGTYRLVFESANHTAAIYLDGELLRRHFGGHTTFHADVRIASPGAHILVVLVDNVFDTAVNALHYPKYDWYQHGGLTAPVSLERLPETWIDDLRITTTAWREGRVEIALTSRGRAGRLPLSVRVDDKTLLSEELDTEPDRRVKREIVIPGCIPWSDASPQLYDVSVQLGDDGLSVRTGVRQVRAEGKNILLNDEPVRLVGVNRHHLHPTFGNSLPEQLSFSDAKLIRELGCNFVRGAHYPQDRRFLETCDALGLLVWEESLGWNLWGEEPQDPLFISQCLAQTTEMVEASANHPSVIIYGILNECHSDRKDNRETYRVLLERIRELDPSRPVTYACNTYDKDVCLDLVDIASFNVYPGWYDNLPHPADVPGCFRWIADVSRRRAGAEKPIIISEIGGGAVYGCRDPYKPMWSEEFQADLIERIVGAFFETDFAGLAIWQFCDHRSTQEQWLALRRPRSFNNKGIVDEYRRRKLAADALERFLKDRRLRQ